MGNSAYGCCTKSDLPTQKSESSIVEKMPSDLPKVNKFKKQVKKLGMQSHMETRDRLNIIHGALSELDLTEEPIEDHYEFGEILGAGKYGVVKVGTSIRDDKFKVAIKIIKLEKLKSQYHSVVQEILSLKKIDHPNVVTIHEIFKDESNLYIVMEFVEGRELFDFVVKKHKLLESEAAKIVKQLLKTVKYLNELKLCHRDLKPENIMINPDTLHIKIIDFGLSSYYSDFKMLTTKVGTPYYVAPEVLDKNYHKE